MLQSSFHHTCLRRALLFRIVYRRPAASCAELSEVPSPRAPNSPQITQSSIKTRGQISSSVWFSSVLPASPLCTPSARIVILGL